MLPKTTYDITVVSTKTFSDRKFGERQVKPYNLMCAMTRVIDRVVYDRSQIPGRVDCRAWEGAHDYRAGDAQIVTRVNNLAYKRLVDKLGDSASLGPTILAEGRQAYGMVVGGLIKMLTSARHIRKFEFGKAARELGIPYSERTERKRYRVKRGKRYKTITVKRKVFDLPNGRTVSKTLASGWLLWSYGVSPLMGDIQTAGKVLTSDFPFHRIRGGGSLATSRLETWSTPRIWTYTTRVSVSMSVDVQVRNPNLWLANKLGLVNPLTIVNEAIPFSFVVDWLSNWSDVLSSMTDFVGLNLERPCTNRIEVRTYTNWLPSWRPNYDDYQIEHKLLIRELRLISPSLLFAYERFQWQRGLNAISLLVGFLPRR